MSGFELICDQQLRILSGDDAETVYDLLTPEDHEHLKRWWDARSTQPALARLTDRTWVAVQCVKRTETSAVLQIEDLDANNAIAMAVDAWRTNPSPAVCLDATGQVLAANTEHVARKTVGTADRVGPDAISNLASHQDHSPGPADGPPAGLNPRPVYWDAVRVPLLITSSEGQVLAANKSGEDLFGDASRARKITKLAPAHEASRLGGLLTAAATSMNPQQADVIMELGGVPRWTNVLILPIQGQVALVILVSHHETLPDTRPQPRFRGALRSVVEHSPAPTVVGTRAGRLVYVNQAMKDVSGPIPESLVGADLRAFLAPEFRERFDQICKTVTSDDGALFEASSSDWFVPPRVGTMWIVATGNTFHPDELIVIQLEPVSTGNRAPDGRAIAAVHRWERRKLAQAVHDDVIGPVAAARLALETGSAPIRSVLGMLREAEQAARHTQDDIDPYIEQRGLHKALEAVVERARARFAHRSVDVHVETDPAAAALPPDVQYGVVSIVNQAVMNSYRHTTADEVTVTVDVNDTSLRVTVADNGPGFPGPHPNVEELMVPGHLGLLSMTSRAQLFNGRLWIRNRKIGGAAIEVEIPLDDVTDNPERS